MKATSDHIKLSEAFKSLGFRIWFVGGCVRDSLLGLTPKDVDLCTDATPDEQIEVYRNANIKYFETGIQHGTITAVLKAPYEITSLRTESDHDGRHATVAYTRDLKTDLARRDLTINAMAMTMCGDLIDPFNGKDDLENRVVRFVGNAEERLNEDYLRILRFFRFKDRFAPLQPLDDEALSAILKTRNGLSQISVERVWSEMKQLLMSGFSYITLGDMYSLDVMEVIDFPDIDLIQLGLNQQLGVEDPCSLLGTLLSVDEVRDLANKWKWSNLEKDRAIFIAKNRDIKSMQRFKEMLTDGIPLEWTLDLASMHNYDLDELREWKIPIFPVDGHDLMALGLKGPQIGNTMHRLRTLWKMMEFVPTKESLLLTIQQN